VTLTAAGRELLPRAERALAELSDGLTAARAAGSGYRGRLRIGFAASLALTVLPNLLLAFRRKYPDVQLDIREMTSAPQLQALRDNVIDIGLIRESPTEDPDLQFRTLLTEPFVAVLPASHSLAARRSIHPGQLADEPFVLLPRPAGPQLYDRIVEVCTDAGFTPRIAQHAVEWQTVCALVGAGLGVSIAPASVRRIRLSATAFRSLEPRTARTEIAVAWRAGDHDPVIRNLLEVVSPAGRSSRPGGWSASGPGTS